MCLLHYLMRRSIDWSVVFLHVIFLQGVRISCGNELALRSRLAFKRLRILRTGRIGLYNAEVSPELVCLYTSRRMINVHEYFISYSPM